MTMLQVILLRTHGTCCLTSRNLFAISKEIPFGARSAILLEAGEILNYDSFLLCRNGLGASFGHQVENPFAVFGLACMIGDLVLHEILLIREICVAQLAYQGAADDRLIGERPQLISCYLHSRNVGGRPGCGFGYGLQDAITVLCCKVRQLCRRIVDKVLVLLQTSQQRPRVLPARENQQILV